MAMLSCNNLSLGYAGIKLVENINFQVNFGDYLYIIGENGSGKSTLIKSILNLISPISGEIRLGDGLSTKNIGYLPQKNGIQKDFPATVEEIVLSGSLNKRGLRPFYTKEEKQKARNKMKKMGIEQLAGKSFLELSGGQQQRALISRALCAAEKLLVLDEPVTGLDPQVTTEMYELIRSLNENGITIIMISHDIGAAMRYASHILHIGGNTYFFGTKEEYSQHHNFCNFSNCGKAAIK